MSEMEEMQSAMRRRQELVYRKHYGSGLTYEETRELSDIDAKLDAYEMEQMAPGFRKMARITEMLKDASESAPMLKRVGDLEEEVARLREALEPLAKAADEHDAEKLRNGHVHDYDYSPDDEPLTVHGSGSLTVGDARRARAALKEPKR